MKNRMVKKQVYLEARQDRLLRRLAQASGATQSQLVREAIDSYTKSAVGSIDLHAWKEERLFIGRLMQQGTVSGGRTWARDELHR